ncbi:MAG: hydroxymethylbilane synthase [Chloroflexi bacterium]|nr:hydroxymethylbilane synthase [Chloroflexota bacterium]
MTERHPKKSVAVGTRGSALALRQTEQVVGKLRRLYPEIEFEARIIRTEGDKARDVPLSTLGGRGVFVKELESALRRKQVDFAVHSMKDVPTEIAAGLVLGAVLERADPRDALVSQLSLPLARLPSGARVGTGSPRRASQLKAYRPDFQMVNLRGNVDTRLRKAQTEEFEGVILAAAGLGRLGLSEHITELISPEICLPMVGQGAIALEWREGDEAVTGLLAPLNDPATFQECVAERALLRGLGGGCSVPIAGLAKVDGEILTIRGVVAAVDGSRLVRASETGDAKDGEGLGFRLAEKLLGMGATEILKDG